MDRDDLQLFFVGVSAVASVGLFLQNLSNPPSIIEVIPSSLDGWAGNLLAGLLVTYVIWQVLKRLLGGPVQAASEEMSRRRLDSIKGCVEIEGVVWMGEACLDNGSVQGIDVPYDPHCPHCQTALVDRTQEPTQAERRHHPSYTTESQPEKVFECPNPNCGHTTERKPEIHEEAKALFERDIKRITQTTGEDYSLQALVENVEGMATPTNVWKKYTETVEDNHVSTNCFPR